MHATKRHHADTVVASLSPDSVPRADPQIDLVHVVVYERGLRCKRVDLRIIKTRSGVMDNQSSRPIKCDQI